MAKELYERLGVEDAATKAEIKAAYRRLVKDCHPDQHPNDEAAAERFRSISEARDILMDEVRRRRYDEEGEIDNSAADSITDRAIGQIVDAFFTAVEGTEFPEEKSLMTIVKASIEERRRVLANNIHDTRKKIRKYERVRERIHTTREENPLRDGCTTIIESQQQYLEDFEEQGTVLNRALEICSDYTFDWIMEPHNARRNRHEARREEIIDVGKLASLPSA